MPDIEAHGFVNIAQVEDQIKNIVAGVHFANEFTFSDKPTIPRLLMTGEKNQFLRVFASQSWLDVNGHYFVGLLSPHYHIEIVVIKWIPKNAKTLR